MKISIAMATYNGAEYLAAQLQSFIDQTRQPDELIITDDCSTDHTEAIVHTFAEMAPFEVVFSRNERNLGYCGNFNEALMKTTGDLVLLSDQDDVWFPEKIAHVVSIAERHPEALVVMNDAALTDGELNEVGLTKLSQIRSSGLPMSSFVMGCCCTVRRELLDLTLPIPAGVKGHDVWLVWFAEGLDAKVVDDRVLQLYRRHDLNESKFIANRTTKLTRSRTLLHSAISLLGRDGDKKMRLHVEQLALFADGIKRSLDRGGGKYRQDLEKMRRCTEAIISTQEQRISIREKPIFPRFIAAMRFLASGGYDGSGRFASFVRDVFG